MAALLGRSSSFFFFTSPHLTISSHSPLPGRMSSALFKLDKSTSLFQDASNVVFNPRLKRHGSQTISLRSVAESKVEWVRLEPLFDKIAKQLLTHQGNLLSKSSEVAFLISSALMWVAPPDALAETCEADNSLFNMPLLLFVALVGATVGGLLARQRRGELKRLNEQLRQINAALRRQAKIESYAPTLSYAPVGGSRVPDTEVIVDPRKEELIIRLKSGKNFLRNQELEKAFDEFKAALELAQSLKDPIEEKKAARGLGASLQRQGKYREAINYHSLVLAISQREEEESGNTEAYGAIADCYTELGDLEKAGKFYDQYIARLEKD